MTRVLIEGVGVQYGSGSRAVSVLRDVNLDVPAQSVLGIVGESGSGKSTLARAIAGLVPLRHGSVTVGDHPAFGRRRSRQERRRVQMAFQDPSTSLNPRLTVEQTLGDACLGPRGRRAARVSELLADVGLGDEYSRALPRDLSGGQRQRVSLARAIAADPEVLICDEVTSALDAATRGAILSLLMRLQERHGFTLLFISHDVGAVRHICDQVAVMYAGQVVEVADVAALDGVPAHPYTRVLLDAVPSLDRAHAVNVLDFEPVDPRDPPSGCRFHPRCPIGPFHQEDRDICVTTDPASQASTRVNHSACHFAPKAFDQVPPPEDQLTPARNRFASVPPSGGTQPPA
ncbi:ABC transporter ATP-binding protein [Streptomyces canus]|uniref:ABC transporter ATP-binding protein n=1 Tax=Streptomyces canus TaxID=58343 RepID=UPI002E30C609|nr:ABC transporter ATP-binding protein [Streptomyces canus]